MYGAVMMAALYAVLQIKTYKADSTDKLEPVTIIIAARNEERHIERCLDSILAQDFPTSMLEVNVVDDHSEDGTATIINEYVLKGVQYLKLFDEDGYGKKAALNKGIRAATHSIIVTTDADCLFHKSWLSTLVSFRKKTNSEMVVAPVSLLASGSLLSVFQSLEFISLQGMTMAGVSSGKLNMCNGANLLYNKAAFYAVDGFKGIDHIATGDDMLLMEKISEVFPGKINYYLSKEAIVETEPAISLKAFFQQRIRWASKAVVYKSISIKATLLLVYILNVGLIICLIMGSFNQEFFIAYILITLSKTLIELPFMLKVSSFFEKQQLLFWFLPMQPLHQLYIVISGFFGLVGGVEWKGRSV
jgi:cellulose synthase/poly-beta-1,6-N-acetylglucosamine synthase-like glycosyltransferase